jgi:hypothetical protein
VMICDKASVYVSSYHGKTVYRAGGKVAYV